VTGSALHFFAISKVAADRRKLMICRSALCRRHPLPASAKNWTRSLTTAPISYI